MSKSVSNSTNGEGAGTGIASPPFDGTFFGVLGPLAVEAVGPVAEEEELTLAFFFLTTFVGN